MVEKVGCSDDEERTWRRKRKLSRPFHGTLQTQLCGNCNDTPPRPDPYSSFVSPSSSTLETSMVLGVRSLSSARFGYRRARVDSNPRLEFQLAVGGEEEEEEGSRARAPTDTRTSPVLGARTRVSSS